MHPVRDPEAGGDPSLCAPAQQVVIEREVQLVKQERAEAEQGNSAQRRSETDGGQAEAGRSSHGQAVVEHSQQADESE